MSMESIAVLLSELREKELSLTYLERRKAELASSATESALDLVKRFCHKKELRTGVSGYMLYQFGGSTPGASDGVQRIAFLLEDGTCKEFKLAGQSVESGAEWVEGEEILPDPGKIWDAIQNHLRDHLRELASACEEKEKLIPKLEELMNLAKTLEKAGEANLAQGAEGQKIAAD